MINRLVPNHSGDPTRTRILSACPHDLACFSALTSKTSLPFFRRLWTFLVLRCSLSKSKSSSLQSDESSRSVTRRHACHLPWPPCSTWRLAVANFCLHRRSFSSLSFSLVEACVPAPSATSWAVKPQAPISSFLLDIPSLPGQALQTTTDLKLNPVSDSTNGFAHWGPSKPPHLCLSKPHPHRPLKPRPPCPLKGHLPHWPLGTPLASQSLHHLSSPLAALLEGIDFTQACSSQKSNRGPHVAWL